MAAGGKSHQPDAAGIDVKLRRAGADPLHRAPRAPLRSPSKFHRSRHPARPLRRCLWLFRVPADARPPSAPPDRPRIPCRRRWLPPATGIDGPRRGMARMTGRTRQSLTARGNGTREMTSVETIRTAGRRCRLPRVSRVLGMLLLASRRKFRASYRSRERAGVIPGGRSSTTSLDPYEP